MIKVEALFFWAAVWLYGLAFLSFLFAYIFKKDRYLRVGWCLIVAALLSQTASMGTRWSVTGHPPVMGEFENSMLGSWFIVILFIIVRAWHRKMEVVILVVIPAVLWMVGNGLMTDLAHRPLAPSFKSNWLWFHVFFAWVAYGAFCVGAGMGFMYILKDKFVRRGEESSFFQRLPNTEMLSDVILRVIMFGFIALTVEIGAGAIWAYGLWGRYWGWDPIETWSLVTWLTYGSYIHLGVTLGWKGRRMAWLAIASLFFVFVSFGGIGYFGGVHTTIL